MDTDRELLIRIDERVNGLAQTVRDMNTSVQANLATKPELIATNARLSRVEKMTYGIIASFIALAFALATTIFQRGGIH